MDPITDAEFRLFAPSARADYRTALVNGWDELQRAGINTPARIVSFLGQCAHETGGFTILREDTSWTPAQMCNLWPHRFKTALDPRILACGRDPRKKANLAYANRANLGNRGGDDGWDYRGGSFLQATGRAMYEELQQATGIPFASQPELIERADIGLKAAIYVWTKHGCNALADRGQTTAIGNAINRGSPYSSLKPIGHDDRTRWTKRADEVFGDGATPPVHGVSIGSHGVEVEALQRRLRELNYGTGKIDGVFGPATARALAAFKADARRTGRPVEDEDTVGPQTWAALNMADPVVYAERSEATEADLAGSETVTAAKGGQAAGTVVVAVSAAKGVQETGLLDGMTQTLGWVSPLYAFMAPVVDAAAWGLRNAVWVVTLVGGVWFWTRGRKIVQSRLRDHRLGFNLFR